MGHFLTAGVVLLVAMWVVARQVRVAKLRSWVTEPLPEHVPDQEGGAAGGVALHWDTAFLVGAGVGEAVYWYHGMDRDVLSAIASEHINLNSLAAIHSFVVDHDPSNVASFQGFVNDIRGRTGEQVLKHHLESLGMHVNLADSSSQPGWDMKVNGDPLQVKTGSDPAAIYEHFQRYPDIPVAASPEMAAHFPDNPMVTGYTELDPTALNDTVHRTYDSLASMDGGIHDGVLGFSPVTLVRSSWHEIKLLHSGATDWSTAAFHVAADTAVRAGGARIGGWLLGAVGGLLGPTGAAAGYGAGTSLGAMAGQFTSELLKNVPLRRSARRLEAASDGLLNQSQRLLDMIESDLNERMSDLREQAWHRLQEALWPTRQGMLVRYLIRRCGKTRAHVDHVRNGILSADDNTIHRAWEMFCALTEDRELVTPSVLTHLSDNAFTNALSSFAEASQDYARNLRKLGKAHAAPTSSI